MISSKSSRLLSLRIRPDLQLARLTPDVKETLVSPGLGRIAEELGGIKGLAVVRSGPAHT